MKQISCPNTEILQEYLENINSSGISAEHRQHIESCTQCKTELSSLSKLFADLKVVSQTPVREDKSARISSVMESIKNIPESNSATPNMSLFASLLDNLSFRFSAIGAIAILLLLFASVFFSQLTSTNKIKSTIPPLKFSLKNNQVTSLFSSEKSRISVDKVEVSLNAIKQITLEKTFKLPEGISISVNAGKNRLKFKSAAQFSLGETFVKIDQGDLSCKMGGFHDGFKVYTPFAEISTIGTDFEVSIRDWGVKVKLISGKILLKTKNKIERKLFKSETIYISTSGNLSSYIPQPKTVLPAKSFPNSSTDPTTPERNDSGGTEPKNLLEAF